MYKDLSAYILITQGHIAYLGKRSKDCARKSHFRVLSLALDLNTTAEEAKASYLCLKHSLSNVSPSWWSQQRQSYHCSQESLAFPNKSLLPNAGAVLRTTWDPPIVGLEILYTKSGVPLHLPTEKSNAQQNHKIISDLGRQPKVRQLIAKTTVERLVFLSRTQKIRFGWKTEIRIIGGISTC